MALSCLFYSGMEVPILGRVGHSSQFKSSLDLLTYNRSDFVSLSKKKKAERT